MATKTPTHCPARTGKAWAIWVFLKVIQCIRNATKLLFVRLLNKKYLWYASYGSNLQRNRFLCYIRGGRPFGSSTNHEGSRSNSYPISEKPIVLNHELYFAKKTPNWDNGGVAFIKNRTDPAKITLG